MIKTGLRKNPSSVFALSTGAAMVIAGLFLFGVSAVSAEEIRSFEAELELDASSDLVITETIKYDFGYQNRHGIFRTIPKTHAQEASTWYKDRVIEIELLSVQQDGAPAQYTVSDSDEELFIKIGDPDVTITGEHEYEIAYRVHGAVSYFPRENEAELYWNVTGHDWDVPMFRVTAHLVTDPALLGRTRSCYADQLKGPGSCNDITVATSGVSFTSLDLMPGAGVTIAQSLDPKKVETVIIERTNTLYFWIIGGVMWLIGLAYFVYRYRTRHDPNEAIIAEYEPLPDFKPMFTGVLLDGRLDPQDITAGLVYLAQQGFITIKKTDRKVLWLFEVDDYEITLKKPVHEAETEFLQEVLQLLFSKDEMIGTATVALSALKSKPGKQRQNHQRIQKLKAAVIKDLVERGYYEQWLALPKVFALLVLVGFGSLFFIEFLIAQFGAMMVPLVILFVLSLVILAFAYRRLTPKGYEARNHLEGFKDFLSTTDRDRFSFHNAPEKNPEQFMEYLPYAIAFGVEKEWAEVFKDVTIADPDWYQGQAGSFSAVALSNDIGAFSSSFTSSSGASASSGGGSAGGGGGGGGGGSW